MIKIKKQVSRRSVPGRRNVAGISYLYLPQDVDRVEFIANCYKTATVSIINDYGERFDNVPVSKTIFQDLYFPKKSKELGTQVFWVNLSKYDIPFVVAPINKLDEFLNLEEYEFSQFRQYGDNIVEISGNAKKGTINVNIDSDTGGQLNINVKNKNGSGKINLKVDGEVNLDIGKSLKTLIGEILQIRIGDVFEGNLAEIQYKRGEGFTYKDEFENQIITKDGEVELKSEKLKLGNGEYSVKNLLEDIITEISNSTTATSLGNMPLLNKVQILALKNKIRRILT